MAAEEKEEDINVQVYCFMDALRACGPDCAAFIVEPMASEGGGLVAVPDRCNIIRGVRHFRQLPILIQRMDALIAKVK